MLISNQIKLLKINLGRFKELKKERGTFQIDPFNSKNTK